ncbi:MAG: GTP 3',8-cyclase MoaA [Desulfobacterales bacterium]|nr:GTP 3',8-cyclase MoaA [Desulfobacterales bacterium]
MTNLNPITPQLIDACRRKLNYLRVSITDRCNLRCIYCVPRDRIPKLAHDDILRYEEILRIVRTGVRLGITKVRVTGGEPLVRKGVFDFLSELTRMEGIEDVSLTTNGMTLATHMDQIVVAGINRINVSLDSLEREKFAAITGRDGFDRVWAGIEKAMEKGLSPIKINVVAMAGVNDNELIDMARLTIDRPLHVRFIEFMPMGTSGMDVGCQMLTPEIQAALSPLGHLEPVENGRIDGPARRFRLPGAAGEIGFISAISHHFCSTCNRLRLTANGQLRPCLMSDVQVDLKGPLRSGATDADIENLFFEAIAKKPSEHHLSRRGPAQVSQQMCAIGG